MLWLDELKIAILNKNDEKVLTLIQNLPKFDNIDDLICARELVGEFKKHLEKDKEILAQSMRQMRQARFFLED